MREKRNAVRHEICLQAVEEFDLDCCTRFDLKFNIGSGVYKYDFSDTYFVLYFESSFWDGFELSHLLNFLFSSLSG